ncbi:MAG: hypothetical protein FWH55_11645 [Oscillospiraceae bacterium]|nr:hypothetical protein [Oscillospiraceae bacterium]
MTVSDSETKTITYLTPMGELVRKYRKDHDGSWAPANYLINENSQYQILKYIISNTHYEHDFSKVHQFLEETEGFGVCDLVIFRSPFGKIIHEYLGFENTVYELNDNYSEIMTLMRAQEDLDLKLVCLAADGPAKIVIISDHADQNLISPLYYLNYCIPFYKRICDILHQKGKYVSTHLDGNFKGYFGIIKNAGFDYLDGCTPAPMFNYTARELAEAILPDVHCYLGVPASMFLGYDSVEDVCNYAVDIAKVFDNKVIINVGDILPPGGDIDLVIAIGEALRRL